MSADKNKLYYGDNLDVLQRYVKDESVDLVYLDPPFNSRQDYNVLFAEKDGSQSSWNTQLAPHIIRRHPPMVEAKGFS
jgi:site-specific DNA-methyltransferase (adenine-specific)